MKRYLATVLLLVSGLVYAVPISNFTATAPTEYTDQTTIPVEDILTYRLYCGNTLGGPYNFFYDVTDITSFSIDVGTCVQGVVGIYYFVATAQSTVHSAESEFSNEASRIYVIADIPKVPNAPTLLTVG